MKPSNGAQVIGTLERVRVENGGSHGMFFNGVGGSVKATVRNSVSTSNSLTGIYVKGGGAGGPTSVMMDASAAINNISTGVAVDNATIRMGSSTGVGNGGSIEGSQIISFGNNQIHGNGLFEGNPTTTVTPK